MARPLVVLALALAGCGSKNVSEPPPPPPPKYEGVGENVLLIIADDLGIEQVSAYGHPSAVDTPNIDALAARGVRFDYAYTYTYCSPTRAAMLTGRIGRRTGFGKIAVGGAPGLSRRAPSIARVARGAGYRANAVGKWHMTNPEDFDHPNDMGFTWYAGSLMNPPIHSEDFPGRTGYFRYEKIINGRSTERKQYMTTDSVDDALARIEAMPEPWFLWLAFNAPHFPAHVPPPELHRLPGIVKKPKRDSYLFRAMAQALDTEIGRLFASMDPEVLARTNIIFLSDNGTPAYFAYPPHRHDRTKGEVYEGGMHVPFIVAGPAVTRPGTRTSVNIHAVDVFATIAELVGADLSKSKRDGAPVEFDGRSFMPWVMDPDRPNDRRYVFGEHFEDNGAGPYLRDDRTVRDEKYRLVRRMGDLTPGRLSQKDKKTRAKFVNNIAGDEFYELPPLLDEEGNLLTTGLDEGPNLMWHMSVQQWMAYFRLSSELDRYFAERPYVGY